MRVCPTCGRSFEGDAKVCGHDGARLVDPIAAAEAAATLAPGTTLDDRYVLQERLGAGGMGDVFVARQTSVGREVAIKVLGRSLANDVTQARRFLREVRASSALQHPHIVTIHDFGQTDEGLLYLVMERVRGTTLAAVLDRDAPLTVERAAKLSDQILDALDAAHEAGIVHRDLKPDNVLVGDDDHVTLLDFGIAAVAGREGTALTIAGQVCGTPDYMSPERARGEAGDHRVDLYALGVMLYEMLRGERPFTGNTALAVMTKHVNEPAPALEVGSQALRALVARALAKRADERFADATEMRQALHGATIGASSPYNRTLVAEPVSVDGPTDPPDAVAPAGRVDDVSKPGATGTAAPRTESAPRTPTIASLGELPAVVGGRPRWPWLVAIGGLLLGAGLAWLTTGSRETPAPDAGATPVAAPAPLIDARPLARVIDAGPPAARVVDAATRTAKPATTVVAPEPKPYRPKASKAKAKKSKKTRERHRLNAIKPSLSDLK